MVTCFDRKRHFGSVGIDIMIQSIRARTPIARTYGAIDIFVFLKPQSATIDVARNSVFIIKSILIYGLGVLVISSIYRRYMITPICIFNEIQDGALAAHIGWHKHVTLKKVNIPFRLGELLIINFRTRKMRNQLSSSGLIGKIGMRSSNAHRITGLKHIVIPIGIR